MKVLSLFDGMSCANLAMRVAGQMIARYVAYEIDSHAIKVSKHNIPNVEHRGDVFDADFTEFEGFDFLMGGSPCTFWSIAQSPDKRETTSSGFGWELFSQYTRALAEAKPRFFIYENNKSMSKEIRKAIDDAFGFGAVLINSALVSAQNRNRLYWVGKRNEDGTYSKVEVEQPKDRGLVVADILDSGFSAGASPNNKAHVLTASYYKTALWNTLERSQRTMVAVPMYHTPHGYNSGGVKEHEKCNTLTASSWQENHKVITPIRVGDLPNSEGVISGSQATRIYATGGKSVNLVANGGGQVAKTGLYAVPSTPKTPKVYEVKDGQITIDVKGEPRTCPTKLADGFYTIRKLSVAECMRLQTVPEEYDFSVISNTQAYKCLGNGWTIEVIAHLIKRCIEPIPAIKTSIQRELF